MYYPKFDHILNYSSVEGVVAYENLISKKKTRGGRLKCFPLYSLLPITRTFKGNRKKFKLSGVRLIWSSKQIAGSMGKTSFYCAVNILITFNCRNGR